MPAILFQDALSGPTNVTIIQELNFGYVPTVSGGGTGSGTWHGNVDSHQIIITADGYARTNSDVTVYAECSAIPESDWLRTECDVKVKSIPPTVAGYAYLMMRFQQSTVTGGDPQPTDGYYWGLGGDGAGGLTATFAARRSGSFTTLTAVPVPHPSVGDLYHLTHTATVTGGTVVSTCTLTKVISGVTNYLDPTGAWQTTLVPAVVYRDANPPPLVVSGVTRSSGLRLRSPSGADNADLQVRDFKVTDLSPPATRYNWTGPATGTLGSLSTPFTIQPDGPSTGTITPSDGGAGGVFSPSSVTWSDDALPRTVRYAAGSASATLSLTGTRLTVNPPTLAFTAEVSVAIDRCWIDPTGNLLLISAKRSADGSPLGIIGAGAAGALTPSAGGASAGAPVALTTPLYSYQANSGTLDTYVIYPLRQAPSIAFTDDLTARFTGSGWRLRDVRPDSSSGTKYYLPGYTPGSGNDNDHTRWRANAHIVVGDTFHETPTATDTAVFTIGGLTPGRNRLSQLLWSLAGPDRTSAATYTVVDGVDGTTILATFTVDQTKSSTSLNDDTWAGYHWANLGPVTCRGTSVLITVANANPTGTLVVDCIRAVSDPLPVVPSGGSATISLPSGTIQTTAGSFVTLTNHPATRVSDAEWSPIPTTGRMKVGYNVFPSSFRAISLTTADRARDCSPWTGAGGHPFDPSQIDPATGELISCVQSYGSWPYREVLIPSDNGESDGWGLVSGPVSSTWRAEYTSPGSGTPTAYFATPDAGNFGRGGQTIVSLGGNRWETTQLVSNPYTPLAQATYQWKPGWCPNVVFYTESVITQLSIYDGSNAGTTSMDGTVPRSWPHVIHPGTFRQLAGYGLTLRMLDWTGGWGSNNVELADLPNPALISTSLPNPTPVITVTEIAPADLNDTGPTGAASWFANQSWTGVARFTTATPHGLVTGQTPVYTDTANRYSSGFPSNHGGNLYLGTTASDGQSTYNYSYRVVVIDKTHFLGQLYYWQTNAGGPGGNGPSYSGGAIATLAGPQTLTGVTLQILPQTGLPPFIFALTMVAETGSNGWFNVNELMSDQGMADLFDAILTHTTAGTTIYLEPSNEHWNYLGTQAFYWFKMYQKYLASQSIAAPMTSGSHAYAYFCNRCFTIARARFTHNLGGSSRLADLICVAGAFQYGNSPVQDISDFFFANRLTPPDAVSVGGYLLDFSPPCSKWNNSDDNAAAIPAFARLDIDEYVSVMAIMVQGNGWKTIHDGTRAVLDAHQINGVSYFANTTINCYETGIQTINLASSDTAVLHALVRHPRMYPARMAWNATLEAAGYSDVNIYTLNYTSAHGYGSSAWFHTDSFNQVGSKADGSDGLYTNVNPFNAPAIVSPQLKAMQDYATLPAPGTTPMPKPTPPTPTPTLTPALTEVDLTQIAQVAWEAAAARLPASGRPGPPTWLCPIVALYGDDGQGKWTPVGSVVSIYAPDGQGGWTQHSTAVKPA